VIVIKSTILRILYRFYRIWVANICISTSNCYFW